MTHAINFSAPPEALVRETFARLDAVEEPTLRSILDLHARVPAGACWVCEGCDIDGYEAEAPAWPCRTVETIIETHLGVVLPTEGRPVQQWGLVSRPADGSLDLIDMDKPFSEDPANFLRGLNREIARRKR